MKKKIKLIFFHPYSDVGGADNSLYRLIKNLNLNDFSITFLSLSDSFLKKKLNKKIKFIKLNASRTLFATNELRALLKKNINQNEFKKILLISNQNFANIITIFSTLYIDQVKTILIERNHLDELKFYNNFYDFLKKNILKLLIKQLYVRANMLIGISKKLSHDLQNFTKKKVTTVYNPSYDGAIHKQSKITTSLSNKYKYIINISRFTKRKDHSTTLKAFKMASEVLKDIKLLLIGYGPELKNIITMSKNLGIYNMIKIIKKCHNPFPFLRKSDLLILTSHYEGFGNVLVEALTLGVPVISTNCKSGPSEILLNGKGGDLIEIGDYKDLSKKIINHFVTPKRLLKKTMFAQKHLQRFEIKKHSKIYSNIFKKL
jgi:glycosyltransferase involved in cell wall biosynthesis